MAKESLLLCLMVFFSITSFAKNISSQLEVLGENYFSGYIEKYFNEGFDYALVGGDKVCQNAIRCEAFRNGSIEFIFQYGEDINIEEVNKILFRVLEEGIFPINEEQWIDIKLLSKIFGFSYFTDRDFSPLEIVSYTEKLCAYAEFLSKNELSQLECATKFQQKTPADKLTSLINFSGKYQSDRSQLYMFCRTNRNFPCYLLLKDSAGTFVSDEDGELWGQASLGLSRKGKAATKRDGHTPSGVLLLNGVMPEASKKYIYGKYRRLMIDFSSESQIQQWLPRNHLEQEWWKEAQIAKKVGRKYLRVHGTGRINRKPSKSFYPFIATIGCVAQRENRYKDLSADFHDQNTLLNALMKAQGLERKYENHINIRSVLYVVEIDSKNETVSREDVFRLLE